MLNSIQLFVIGIIAVCITASCESKQEDKTVTTDVVNISASASGKEDSEKPFIKFEEESHDFGKITQGEKVSHSFKFKNTGNADLIISSAQASCGCTVPHYPKDPIAPGKEGEIDVVFDSEGKEGIVKKTITIVTNANPGTQILTINTDIAIPSTNNNNESKN